MLGWRAEVMAKRGSKAKNTYQIKVFGHWFELGDTARIMPVKQLEEQGRITKRKKVPPLAEEVPEYTPKKCPPAN